MALSFHNVEDTVRIIELLPPATKLRQGNVFTSVCYSVHRGGSLSQHAPQVT